MATPNLTQLSLVLVTMLTACAPWPEWPAAECPEVGCTTTDDGTSSGGAFGEVTGTVTGVTSGASDDGTAAGSDGATAGETGNEQSTSTTTGEPIKPPVIVDVEMTPDPIIFNGPIAVTVNAEHTEGVRMKFEDGEEVELVAAEPGVFVGEIAVMTGLLNGLHVAALTPWASDSEGEAVEASYTIALPAPGSEAFWEAGDLIGGGQVVSMGVLPDGNIVEFGTQWIQGGSRCYVRRRDKSGAWKQSDFQAVLPGVQCEAIDMKISPAGAIFVLARRASNNSLRWWLGEIATWGASPANRGLGENDHVAAALGLHASGMVAVCGSVPTQEVDGKDAATWLFRPNLPGESRVFDYRPEEDAKPHEFAETIRDCAFAGDSLVSVGEAFGKHEKWSNLQLDRHFVLEFETKVKTDDWIVASGDLWSQSGATTIVVDDQGRYFTGGYVCGDTCNPIAELRAYDPDGTVLWKSQIGEIPVKTWGPHDLVWSPAGYAIIALGGTKGNEIAFSVRAYATTKADPLWVYSRKDNQYLQMARALAVGHFGEVYVGGFGMNSYPAVAYVGG